jgi:hypothetical protein
MRLGRGASGSVREVVDDERGGRARGRQPLELRQRIDAAGRRAPLPAASEPGLGHGSCRYRSRSSPKIPATPRRRSPASAAAFGTIAARHRDREAVPFYRESDAGHRALPLAPPIWPDRTRQTHSPAEHQRGAVLRAAGRDDGRPARVDDRRHRVRGADHRPAGRLDRGAPGAPGAAGRRRASRARPHPCVNALEGGLRCATCVRRAPGRSRCSPPPPTSNSGSS